MFSNHVFVCGGGDRHENAPNSTGCMGEHFPVRYASYDVIFDF